MLFKQLLDSNIAEEKFLFFVVSNFLFLFLSLTSQWDIYKDFFLCVFIILRVFQLHTYLYKDKLEILTIVNIHLNGTNKLENIRVHLILKNIMGKFLKCHFYMIDNIFQNWHLILATPIFEFIYRAFVRCASIKEMIHLQWKTVASFAGDLLPSPNFGICDTTR
jgi:hypothetical protein